MFACYAPEQLRDPLFTLWLNPLLSWHYHTNLDLLCGSADISQTVYVITARFINWLAAAAQWLARLPAGPMVLFDYTLRAEKLI